MCHVREIDAQDDFKRIFLKYISPLLQVNGNLYLYNIANCKLSVNRHIIVSRNKDHINIYPCLVNPQFYCQIGIEPNASPNPAEDVLREIMRVSTYVYSNPAYPYRMTNEGNNKNHRLQKNDIFTEHIYNLAYEVGLCNWLGGPVLYKLISKMQKWSLKTYEGRKIPFSFLYDFTNNLKAEDGNISYADFLDSNHSAVFTDGISSALALTYEGNVFKYKSPFSSFDLTKTGNTPFIFAPYRYNEFASLCGENEITLSEDTTIKANWLGIVSQTNGDILIFKKYALILTKRNGAWFQINDYKLRSIIYEHLNGEPEDRITKAKEVFISLLDVSFSRSGGCLAIVEDDYIQEVSCKYVSPDDNYYTQCDTSSSNEERKRKKNYIQVLIKAGNYVNSFFEIDRKLRHELLSLDGANIIDRSGKLIGIGAIVHIGNSGSDHGGREAAARQLSQFGLAIKISTDGKIQGFYHNEVAFSIL